MNTFNAEPLFDNKVQATGALIMLGLITNMVTEASEGIGKIDILVMLNLIKDDLGLFRPEDVIEFDSLVSQVEAALTNIYRREQDEQDEQGGH